MDAEKMEIVLVEACKKIEELGAVVRELELRTAPRKRSKGKSKKPTSSVVGRDCEGWHQTTIYDFGAV